MTLSAITAQTARQHLDRGALLVDVRAADEYAREHIHGARHIPMSQIANHQWPTDTSTVVFYCRSGYRTQVNAQALGAAAGCEAYSIKGGLNAWKQAGLPVIKNPSQPLELNRQVQITAGLIIVLGAVLGATVSPWFHLLSGFVGAGLIFAGVSGFCGMARVLMKMPWNRRLVS